MNADTPTPRAAQDLRPPGTPPDPVPPATPPGGPAAGDAASPSDPDQPVGRPIGPPFPIGEAVARSLVTAASLAPSLHNAQPWRFRLLADGTTLQLWADLDRVVPHADPDGRGLHLGCGAAICNLRVAAAHAGLLPDVRLLPEPAEPRLLADMVFRRLPAGAPEPREAAGLAALYPAIRARRTSRHPFLPERVPGSVRAELTEAARAEGAELVHPDSWHTATVLELLRDAEGRDGSDPARERELERWTRTGPEAGSAVDGVPEYAFGPRERDGRTVVRDFAGRAPLPGRAGADFESAPQLVLLGTDGDRPFDWLRAGEALERVLLVATDRGLATSLSSQALEWDELRWPTRDPMGPISHVQMIIRLGYGPESPPTPRRAVTEILEIGHAMPSAP
ncbi:nitroreductase family protein [Streptomyces sp. ST2-7A]|uniref:Acg family FMN-binding oxidoreductase n=1 Tax=Streptomyces sp. ST2-7A TaxID=2907214 RepID=UPI001F45B229|nr:nitroreductase family protein [Streptomyces sp. ST2-7A]MCE7079119.1 nitroreductase family protein [Streptomyces sp. ST2-7A]